MNYIKQLNTFHELLIVNSLNANSQCLYYALLYINNRCNWKKEFTVANSTLMSFTSLNISAMQRARNQLVQKEYIKYKKGTGNNAGTYSIIEFEQQNEQQIDNNVNSKPITNRQQTDNKVNTLDKLNKTKLNKTNKEEKIKKREQIKDVYNSLCFNLPQVQKLTEKRNKAIDAFIKDFTVEQFEIICKIANNSSFLKGENDRHWKADFDFLMRVDKATSILEGKYSNDNGREENNGANKNNTTKQYLPFGGLKDRSSVFMGK